MKFTSRHEKCAAAIADYTHHYPAGGGRTAHWICALCVMFSFIGLLAAINFGLTLIAIAAAILYYNRFGQKAALHISALLIVMLMVWVTIMPPHHLVAAAAGILMVACIGRFGGYFRVNSKLSLAEDVRYLPAAALYALAGLKEKLAGTRHFDPL